MRDRIVTGIEPGRRPDGTPTGLVDVELDGRRWVRLAAEDAERLALVEGQPVAPAAVAEAERCAARIAGVRQAGRMLARRSHSRVEVERAVAAREGEAAAEETVELLAGRGLLDDAAHTREVVERLLDRGWGPDRIAFDLERAGVEAALARSALDALTPEQVRGAAARAVRGLDGPRAWRRLALRGFDEEVALDVIGAPPDDTDEPSEPVP